MLNEVLHPAVIVWEDNGKNYWVAVCDLEAELEFEKRHIAYARSVSASNTAADQIEALRMHEWLKGGGQFCFGGPLWMAFIDTPVGKALYLNLLMQRGHDPKVPYQPPSYRELMRRFYQQDASVLRLWEKVVQRDFPFLTGSPAPVAGETHATSTTNYSSD